MDQHNWIGDVLKDLETHATDNVLNELRRCLELAQHIARSEAYLADRVAREYPYGEPKKCKEPKPINPLLDDKLH